MGLLFNMIDRESLKPGDHIYSWRAAYIYAHHGIYIGDDKVIHFTRFGEEVGTGTVLDRLLVSSMPRSHVQCTNCNPPLEGHGVILSCLDCFLAGGTLHRFEYRVGKPSFFLTRGGTSSFAVSDPNDVVIDRAKCLLTRGFGCYNVCKNNCEDFAIYCKTGLVVVNQGASGQAEAVIGGPVAAVWTATLRLLSKTSPFGMVTTTAWFYCANRYANDVGIRKDAVKVAVEDLTRGLGGGEVGSVTGTLIATPA